VRNTHQEINGRTTKLVRALHKTRYSEVEDTRLKDGERKDKKMPRPGEEVLHLSGVPGQRRGPGSVLLRRESVAHEILQTGKGGRLTKKNVVQDKRSKERYDGFRRETDTTARTTNPLYLDKGDIKKGGSFRKRTEEENEKPLNACALRNRSPRPYEKRGPLAQKEESFRNKSVNHRRVGQASRSSRPTPASR